MAELDHPRRLAAFKASLLTLDSDSVLQDCVERAAQLAEAPMAMVSFVMEKIQLFRASVGLPVELDATRATARNQSFCQFVVKAEAPFIVMDAKRDRRVPRRLLDVYGIGAYAGVPIRVGGQVLGALCVADWLPRQWSPELAEALNVVAIRVSERLETLSASNAGDDVTNVPRKNLAARAAVLAQMVHRSLAEVGPMVRLARGTTSGLSPDAVLRAGRALAEAGEFYDEMMSAMAELCVATQRVEQSGVTAPTEP